MHVLTEDENPECVYVQSFNDESPNTYRKALCTFKDLCLDGHFFISDCLSVHMTFLYFPKPCKSAW